MKDRNLSIYNPVRGEQGFVLVMALIALVVLSLIGLAAMNTSNIEKTIAQNINEAEKNFYGADGGTEAGIEILEWNLSSPLGFNGTGIDDTNPGTFWPIGGLQISDSKFAYDQNENDLPWDPVAAGLNPGAAFDANYVASDGARSIRIPETMAIANDGAPHTNVAIYGTTTLGAGSAIQMGAGYEGKGRGAAGGGSVINYQINSRKIGFSNSQSYIRRGWQHSVGSEGNCRPFKR